MDLGRRFSAQIGESVGQVESQVQRERERQSAQLSLSPAFKNDGKVAGLRLVYPRTWGLQKVVLRHVLKIEIHTT
jgi:hypothetical protein